MLHIKKACNRAGTVLYALENAVAIHGLLSSICGDHGTENYDVHWYKSSKKRTRGRFIAGKSCQDQRIERL